MTRHALFIAGLLLATTYGVHAQQGGHGNGQNADPTAEDAQQIRACYVQGAGVIYRIGTSGAPANCHGNNHVEFTWNALIDLETLQHRVAAACPEGSSIRAIEVNGNVICESDNDAAADVAFGDFQRLVTGACAEGSSISTIQPDGNVVCEPDNDSAAGVSFDQFQQRVTGQCATGWSMRAIDVSGGVACQDATFQPSVSGEVAANAGEGSDRTERDLGPTANRLCFLTEVGVEEADSDRERASCSIVAVSSRWRLVARVAAGNDAWALCSARCLSW